MRASLTRGDIKWTRQLAYAVGLLATDGNLSSDGRHIELTSKDEEQLRNFMRCIGKEIPISRKVSGFTGKEITRVQFSDVRLYRFLESLGITPRKTLTIGALQIPEEFFFDFLRGHHDGDGSFYSYYDPRWKSSFMYYLVFASASPVHIEWIRKEIKERIGAVGHIVRNKLNRVIQLKYGKQEALRILKEMYGPSADVCLARKRLKIESALRIVGESLS